MLQRLEAEERQKLIREGDKIILDTLKKIKTLANDGVAIDEIKNEIVNIRNELLKLDNVYIKSLLQSSEQMQIG